MLVSRLREAVFGESRPEVNSFWLLISLHLLDLLLLRMKLFQV